VNCSSCFQRRSFLSRPRSCQWLIDGIERSRTKHRFDLWAYVVMPEHVHLLIWPTETKYSISRILETIKLSVTRHALDYVK
jgi:putative transposase